MRILCILIFPAIFLSAQIATASDYLGKGPIKSVYLQHCANCHGKNMEGGMAGSMLDDEWVTDGSDKGLTQAISEGIAGTSMIGWKNTLTPKQIRGLVILIREQKHVKQSAAEASLTTNGVYKSREHNFTLTKVGEGTNKLWAVDFLHNGDLIATQKSGKLWRFSNGKRHEIKGIPQVWDHSQGGLLDVAIHPDNKKNPWVYLSFSDKAKSRVDGRAVGSTTVVRGKIAGDKWTNQEIIFQVPEDDRVNRGWHFGSRIVLQDGYVYFSIGDEGYPDRAQAIDTPSGKIHRLHDDGRIPEDNPFGKQNPTAWTYGNRNAQGLDIHPETNQLWGSEHGPRGGDEINLLERERNYGWPVITYGMEYNGSPITDKTEAPGMEQPKHYWVPSIAVCGIEFYDGGNFPGWKNNLFVGGLGSQQLHRLVIKDNKVVDEEILLKGLGRVRDIANGPDGNLYVIMNGSENQVVKLSPNS